MSISNEANERTRFLNVDLDIYSKTNLKPLVTALGNEVLVLYSGREGRLWSAHLELPEQPQNPEGAIRRLAALIPALPPAAQRLWYAATRREFNIGVQAGSRPHAREIKLAPGTIHKVASLEARLVVTVYAPPSPSNSGR